MSALDVLMMEAVAERPPVLLDPSSERETPVAGHNACRGMRIFEVDRESSTPTRFPMSSVSDSLDEQLSPPPLPEGGRELRDRILELGEWFHNLNLRGVPTAPHHFLGDFPNIKWQQIAHSIPENLSGATVLDVGCNAGFYSIELKKRGARRVVGIDVDDRYLKQARFAAAILGVDIELEKCSIYQVDRIAGGFDYVFFMGVFYHLRYPLFALDRLIKKVAGKLVFQTMVRGSQEVGRWEEDYPFRNTEIFEQRNFPAMYFIEKSYSNDPTNWWIPNRPAVEAMLRSSGLEIEAHPEPETWICRPVTAVRDGQYILDRELEGSL